MVSELAFYSDDSGSNSAEAYSLFCKVVFDKNENKQKGGLGWPTLLKNNVDLLACTREPLGT